MCNGRGHFSAAPIPVEWTPMTCLLLSFTALVLAFDESWDWFNCIICLVKSNVISVVAVLVMKLLHETVSCRLLFFDIGSTSGVPYTGARDLTSLDSFVQEKLEIVLPEVRLLSLFVFLFRLSGCIHTYIRCESKKLGHFYFYCNFGKCWSISIILSVLDS